ncbi:hypothetical protein ACLED0_00150 [Lonsdalea quercina]|uniref:hypothetical protein n=1 Tax=Lonsdalea quercina TaxID=71657 RepID=UPI0039751453
MRLEGTAIRIHPRNSFSQTSYSGGDEKAGNVKLFPETEEKHTWADEYAAPVDTHGIPENLTP